MEAASAKSVPAGHIQVQAAGEKAPPFPLQLILTPCPSISVPHTEVGIHVLNFHQGTNSGYHNTRRGGGTRNKPTNP